ncbi:chromosome segregation protein SMC [Synechocystis sp. LKSZ1]|uniref:chromosome segregation protein SMC n=1 Tax=Synechocystis sp. LKSZ1 TaxID=3144951 RepID=UPI00336C1D06
MVYIKRIELSHFKSFGGTTAIPLLPGFTVVSGPNGSGKSNILDALLFCLGLATSKGLRAERLPDLVNHNHSQQRGSAEAVVTVTFDLENGQDWTVTRRLKVTKGGNYSSSYSINGEAATVAELHEELSQLRIYPEGYNVVLQGDVTRIITMNPKERREIIDELAGVAEFDRKIVKTKETLEEVREREERCRIIETELLRSLERLAADRIKAEKYQKLRGQIQEKQRWEKVLHYQANQAQQRRLEQQLEADTTALAQLGQQIQQIQIEIQGQQGEFEQLNAQVKALGEEEHLAVAAQLAEQRAQGQQLSQQQQQWEQQEQQAQTALQQAQQGLAQLQQQFLDLTQEASYFSRQTLPQLQAERNQAWADLEHLRQQSLAMAERATTGVEEQTRLSQSVSQLQAELAPKRSELAQLQERYQQLHNNLTLAEQQTQQVQGELAQQTILLSQGEQARQDLTQQVQALAGEISQREQERSLLEETQQRLLQEQREKQRQLDKLEATRQAQQEAQGTYATQMILQSELPGICGLVAQLGQVETSYQLALEIAAGGRLGYVVVEDDGVAAAAIALLKQSRAGRATFLPLSKMRSQGRPQSSPLQNVPGYIDLAVNLVRYDPRYQGIFNFIFGQTVVFEDLDLARPHLGRQRIVTLEGDLLETSGALSGGSRPRRSELRFGATTAEDSTEVQGLKQRLGDIQRVLARQEERLLTLKVDLKELGQRLNEARQQLRERELTQQQGQREQARLQQRQQELSHQIQRYQAELDQGQGRLRILGSEIPSLEQQLQVEQAHLTALEASQTHRQWQTLQNQIQEQEGVYRHKESQLNAGEARRLDWQNQAQRLEEKISETQALLRQYQQQGDDYQERQAQLQSEQQALQLRIQDTEQQLAAIAQRLGSTKQARDQKEAQLKALQDQHQQALWQQEKRQQSQQANREALAQLVLQGQALQAELPDPWPDMPDLADTDPLTINYEARLEELQKEIRQAQKRLEAMEPVNMLALEEHEKTQARLDELTEKLRTIEGERTELLLRIENFTTLRQRSFQEAFTAVNENFQTIFAELSDGDGYLQLDNPEDPFSGGLNLVAHPKGKPVQRLSSMSGGEKSLTALSFIFALQRYRPSPFYGFDEVDMFLDGANVEKLSKMVQKQAQQAQFIVVSLRRPMIEAAERTIGVTQARGAHTQVLGIKL